ncbi:MAG: hypothetical protein ABII89_03130 [Candidatus Omnitrophota bacterium]
MRWRGKKLKCFVMLAKELLLSAAYKALSSAAKVIYTYAKLEAGKQNGENLFKHEFEFTYSCIKKYTGLTDPTIASALKDLCGAGFLIRTTPGGLKGAGGVTGAYRLSLDWQSSSPIIKQKRTIRMKKRIAVSDESDALVPGVKAPEVAASGEQPQRGGGIYT